MKGTEGHADTKLLSSPWCNPPVVWVSGAETSIKTWRLSLNLSLALRKKPPQPEFQSSLTHRHRRLPAGLYRARDRSELVLHLGENQILVHFHQLSVSDRYFCRAGQEIGLLNYSLSQGPRHFALLSYRCSINVSHCNHLSLPWLNTFLSADPKCSSVLSRLFCFLPCPCLSPCPSFPLISWLNLRLLGVQAQNQFRGGQQGSVARPDPQQSGLLIIMQATWLPYWDIRDLDITSVLCTVWEPITRFEVWKRSGAKTHSFTWFKPYFPPKNSVLE